MQPSDKPKFLEVLAGVHDFYGKELSTFAGQVWWQAMAGFDLEQATKALSAHLMDADRGMFAPKPADLVRVLSGTHTDRALLAWSAVHGAIGSAGAYASVDFGDQATHAAITDLGGWPAICASKVDELPHLQRRFCESYRVYAKRAGTFEAQPYLLGIAESINRGGGHAVKPPLRIGERARPSLPAPMRTIA